MKNKGCEKLGTAIIDDNECVIFMDSMIENGNKIDVAIQDLRMIDAGLVAMKTHVLIGKTSRYTKAGYIKKNTALSDTLMKLVEGRATGAFNY